MRWWGCWMNHSSLSPESRRHTRTHTNRWVHLQLCRKQSTKLNLKYSTRGLYGWSRVQITTQHYFFFFKGGKWSERGTRIDTWLKTSILLSLPPLYPHAVPWGLISSVRAYSQAKIEKKLTAPGMNSSEAGRARKWKKNEEGNNQTCFNQKVCPTEISHQTCLPFIGCDLRTWGWDGWDRNVYGSMGTMNHSR